MGVYNNEWVNHSKGYDKNAQMGKHEGCGQNYKFDKDSYDMEAIK